MPGLDDIFDRIVQLQTNAVQTPAEEEPLKDATNEPPAQVSLFPIFYNVEDDTEPISRAPAHRAVTYLINMHLLFASGDQEYSVRSRRRWVKNVIDAFDLHIKLTSHGGAGNDAIVRSAYIERVDFEPVPIGQTEYVAATFMLVVTDDDGGAFAP